MAMVGRNWRCFTILVVLMAFFISACGAPSASQSGTSPEPTAASASAPAPAEPTESAASAEPTPAESATDPAPTEASAPAEEPTAAETATEAPAATEPAATGAGVSGGTLRVAQAREPDTLDPDKSASRYNEYITQQIYDELITIDASGTYHPWLATSWEVSDDGLVWTLKLREDVKFHDGTPFNAEAVKFNFDRIVDPETKSVTTISQFGPYKETRVVDEFTVEVVYEQPFAPFLSTLTGSLFGIKSPAAVEKFGEDFLRNPVGTGPFIFVEWLPKERVVLRKNADYNWAPPTMAHQGPAYLDEIIYTFPEEPTTRTALLETGEADVITHVNFSDVERLQADEMFRVDSWLIQGTAAGMLLNTERAPTDDLKVRQAIAYATNPEEISQIVTFGVEVPLKGTLAPPTWNYYNKESELYSYDLAKSQALLEEAGWADSDGDGIREKDGTKLEMIYICFPGAGCQQAEVIQSQLRQAGIDMQLLQLNNPANKEASTRGDHNPRPLAWNHVDPIVLDVMFHPKNVDTGWAFARYRAPELATMLDEAAAIFDTDERIAKYGEVQMHIMENALFVPTIATTYILGINEKVIDVKADPSGYNMMLYDTYIQE